MNWVWEEKFSNMKKRIIKVVDVTLREWDQAPLTSFNAKEKAIIALMLKEMWIDTIEVWFGFSRWAKENMAEASEIAGNSNTEISSLWRALETDTMASLDALEEVKNPRIHIFLAMSKDHINWKFAKKWSTLKERQEKLLKQATDEIIRANNWAKEKWKNLTIEFSPEDATWNALVEHKWKKYFMLEWNPDFEFLVKVCEEAVKVWATVLNVPDTLWNLLPNQTYKFFKTLKERLKYLEDKWYIFWLSAHVHNDLSLASASAVEAIRGWAEYIETTILWIWERAWNTETSNLMWLIKNKWHDIEEATEVTLNPNFNYKLIWPVSDFTKNILWLDKYLQTPFIWALSDIDWSWVHNAASDLYWWSKNKSVFWWNTMPEFFSPRGWANQIVSMLEKYWINEDKRSENIEKTTIKASGKSENSKCLFWSNIYATYLREIWKFKINKIDFKNKTLNLEISLNWENITFSWETGGEDWVIKTFMESINKYLWWSDIVKVRDLKIKAKPSLKQECEEFLNRAWKYVSEDFIKKMNKILEEIEDKDNYSEQLATNQVILEINWEEVYSIASDKNVTIWNIKCILEWVLYEIVKRQIIK